MNVLGTKARIFGWLWAVAVCMAIPAFAQEKRGGVTIDENHIVVHPMTKISKEDAKAINDILTKYDKSLYKLDTYKDGKLKRTQGALSDVNLDQAIASELTAAQGKGESIKTMQLTNPQHQPRTITTTEPVPGASTNPQKAPGTTISTQPVPGASTHPQQAGETVNPQHAAKELIERLKPILEKYSRK